MSSSPMGAVRFRAAICVPACGEDSTAGISRLLTAKSALNLSSFAINCRNHAPGIRFQPAHQADYWPMVAFIACGDGHRLMRGNFPALRGCSKSDPLVVVRGRDCRLCRPSGRAVCKQAEWQVELTLEIVERRRLEAAGSAIGPISLLSRQYTAAEYRCYLGCHGRSI